MMANRAVTNEERKPDRVHVISGEIATASKVSYDEMRARQQKEFEAMQERHFQEMKEFSHQLAHSAGIMGDPSEHQLGMDLTYADVQQVYLLEWFTPGLKPLQTLADAEPLAKA